MSDQDRLPEIQARLDATRPATARPFGDFIDRQELFDMVDWLVGENERLRALLEPSVTMTSPHIRESGNDEAAATPKDDGGS